MVLSIEERKLFFKNWLKLLSFVNKKLKIIDNFGEPDNPVGLDINELMKIRKKLWENSKLIDEFIETSNLNMEDSKIVKSWNNFIVGKYLVIKELKRYCVFFDVDKDILYGVVGISSPFSQTISYFPSLIETVLIPFNEKIIYDSLIESNNISFGPNMKKSFNEKYSEIKKKKGIIVNIE